MGDVILVGVASPFFLSLICFSVASGVWSSTMKDISKLPKWVQQRIERAERNEVHLRAELAAMYEQAPTRTSMGYGPRGGPRLWLPDDHVTLHLKDHHQPYDRGVQFQLNPERDCIYVMGADGLVLHPMSSNTFEIKMP